MPGTLTFDKQHVLELLTDSIKAKTRRANFSQMCDINNIRTDIDPTIRHKIADDLVKEGYSSVVRAEHVDGTKIPIGLWLVGDQGVYLMSNGPFNEEKAKAGNNAAYAAECNPLLLEFDEWYDNKQRIFGGDDGSEFIPGSLFQGITDPKFKKVKIKLTKTSMSVKFTTR